MIGNANALIPRAQPPRYVTEGAGAGSTFRANRYGFARANVVGNVKGGCTRYEDPALSCLLRIKEHQSRQRPRGVAVATSIYLSPAAVPGGPA